MSTRFILTIPVLFVSAFFGGMVLAASTQGSCPSGSMNATQYSSSPRTTSGQLFLPDGLTAAHKKLPFGTRVKVTNPLTGASAIVIINDRGPFTRGRDIDLSQGAARAIGLKSVGTVCTEIL
jgi:rare lipoprotein A